MILRRFFFSLVFAWAVQAQQSTFQQIFTNTHSSGPSAVVRNIGQGAHIVLLVATGGPMCGIVTPVISARLEFSMDGMRWNPFGAPNAFIMAGAPPQSEVWVGAGVYPQVRFNLVSFDTANCAISAWYSGSQIGSGLTQVSGGIASHSFAGTVQNPTINPVLTGIIQSGNTIGAPFACGGGPNLGAPSQGSVPAGTTALVLPLPPASPLADLNVVCGFIITLSAAGTVQFVTGAGAACGTATQPLTPAWTLATGVPLQIYAPFGAALFSTSGQVCLVVTGGTAAYFVSFASLQ